MPANFYTNPYCVENVPLYKVLYGEYLISLGGFNAIENLFANLSVDLQDKIALDIGFGLGGVAFYLAEKYHMQVSGVEINPWMVVYAAKHAPVHLKSSLHFSAYDAQHRLPYSENSFDLVYSKGVLNHVSDKYNLFKQVKPLLKPNGLFIINDWVYPAAIAHTKSKAEKEPLVFETQTSYQHVLTRSGFTEIKFRNDSDVFRVYVTEFLQNLQRHQDFIDQLYGHELFVAILTQHEQLLTDINQQQKMAVRIVAQ